MISKRTMLVGALAVPLFALVAPANAQTRFDTSGPQAGRPQTKAGKSAELLEGKNLLLEPGKLVIAMSPYLPPTSFYADDAKTVIGFNADLITLVAEKLGLQPDIRVVAFPDWPLSIASHKYDVFIGSTTITEARKLKFDFSTYSRDLAAFFVATNSRITKITGPADIAGIKLIVSSGTVAEKIVLDWDAQNRAAGLKPVELKYFDDPAAAELSLRSGQSDAQFVGNYAEGAYNAAVSGQTRLVGVAGTWNGVEAVTGVVTKKGSGLAEPIAAAINESIADGTYQAALDRWGMSDAAIKKSTVNPPGLVIN